mgnify:CR=1 FL=1
MKRNYHHGDLKDALFTGAEKILRESGIKELSMRSVARLVGVSEVAPYNHFSNKEELLEALATEGFRRLSKYINLSLKTDLAALEVEKIALGYIRFALEHHHLFRLMFGHEISDIKPSVGRLAASRASYEPIQTAVKLVNISDTPTPVINIEDMTIGAWSLVHGLATLIIDGKVSLPSNEIDRDQKILSICKAYTVGIYL